MQDDCITIALGLPEVRVVREEETETAIRVEVMDRAESGPCPCCGQKTPKVHSTKHQGKRDRRLWDKAVFPDKIGALPLCELRGGVQRARPGLWCQATQ